MSSTSQVLAQLQKVKYGGLDFATATDDLKANLQVKFASDYNDFATSAMGIVLLDTVGYGLDTLGFYLDRRATDTFLSTARTRRSVARLTRQLGYKMRAAVSSSVDLTVSLVESKAFNVPIPQGFQFKGPNDLVFEVSETVIIPSGSTSDYIVACYQGETITETFVSDGTSNQVFELTRVEDGFFVTYGTAVVTVDGTLWEEQDMLEFEATNQFEIGYNDDPPTIRFGDGVVGNIPNTGATITVTYIISRGKSGIVSRNSINDVVNPLIVSFTTIELNIDNAAGSVGGDDPESIESAKSYAPKVWKSRYVAVTREDYEALAGSYADPLFGRVSVAQALSARSASSDLTLQTYLANIRSLVSGPDVLVAAEITDLETGFASLLSDLAGLETQLTNIAAKTTAIGTESSGAIGSSISYARTDKGYGEDIGVDMANIAQDVIDGKAAVDASTATGPEKLAIKAYFDSIDAARSSSSSAAAGIVSGYSGFAVQLRSVADAAADIGYDLTTDPSYLYSSEQLRANMETTVGDSTVPSGLYANTAEITTIVVDVSDNVEVQLTNIYDHVDSLLAADCKANLVTVPILAKDAAGFYAAPSTGLVKSLQSFLEERNEVTQTVSVVSGELFLAPAVLTIAVGVLPNFSQTATETAVTTAVENLLRARAFGQSLYRSVVYQTIVAVAGVAWANVTINGSYEVPLTTPPVLDTSLLDTEGNLILDDGRVLTRGLVTVTSTQLTYLDSLRVVPTTE
jgi:hypothetical protein